MNLEIRNEAERSFISGNIFFEFRYSAFPATSWPRVVLSTAHRARIPSPLPLRVAKTGRNHLNEEFTPLLPTGIGERF